MTKKENLKINFEKVNNYLSTLYLNTPYVVTFSEKIKVYEKV